MQKETFRVTYKANPSDEMDVVTTIEAPAEASKETIENIIKYGNEVALNQMEILTIVKITE